MANILIISANLNRWEKNSGGVERTATLAEALTGHNVTFLCFSWNDSSEVKKINNNINFIKPGVELAGIKKHKFAVGGPAKKNHDITKYLYKKYVKSFTKKAIDLATKNDLIILDHFSAAPFIEELVGIAPIIYNSHNAEISMAKQLHPEEEFVNSIVEKMESLAIKSSVGMTYCSEIDFQELKDHYITSPKHTAYIPNGTVIQDKINYKKRLKSKDILFVGSAHPPNVVAAKKIVDMATLMPKHNFIIAGSAGNSINKRLVPDNVQVLGVIPDEQLDSLFKDSLAFINPMESGSGTHLKMMKALSYGIPIITSTVGARGFSEKEVASSMLIADDNDECIAAIKLLDNEKIFKELANNGYDLSKKFDWELIKKDYLKFVNDILNSSTKKSTKDSIKKEKVLIYSIVRNTEEKFGQYYTQLKKIVSSFPEYEFYLSIYENDSSDNTKRKLHTTDWSFFNGVSIITENINTEFFGSVKDPVRVENLSNARNKAIEAGGFLDKVDYVLMVEGDLYFSIDSVRELLEFKKVEPKFDVVSAMSFRKNGTHYDWWATRTTAKYNPEASEIDPGYKRKHYGEYYSTSNGLVLYRAEPFKKGIRHGWINAVTKEFDCEMVVLCQNFRAKGYKNIYINYRSTTHV